MDQTSRPLKTKHILTVQEFQTLFGSEEQCWQYSSKIILSTLRLFIKSCPLSFASGPWSIRVDAFERARCPEGKTLGSRRFQPTERCPNGSRGPGGAARCPGTCVVGRIVRRPPSTISKCSETGQGGRHVRKRELDFRRKDDAIGDGGERRHWTIVPRSTPAGLVGPSTLFP
jgi:hypothetical protein